MEGMGLSGQNLESLENLSRHVPTSNAMKKVVIFKGLSERKDDE